MHPQIRHTEMYRAAVPRESATNVRRLTSIAQLLLVGAALTGALASARAQNAAGANFTTIYQFGGAGDGGVPSADLMLAADGNIYGTTIGLVVNTSGIIGVGTSNGADDYGTIFRLSPATGDFNTIYSFRLLGNGIPINGTSPRGGLVQGGSSNILYGTTSGVNETVTEVYDELTGFFDFTFTEASTGNGTVFKFDIAANELTTIYSFGDSVDGRAPVGSLVLGSNGPLYGVTSGGGVFASPGTSLAASSPNAGGSVFSITDTGVLTSLGDFGTTLQGGNSPFSGLVEGGDGNYYGTTSTGGSVEVAGFTVTNEGTVFQVTPQGISTTIYTFTGADDGANPAGGLARPGNGYLYGTTSAGGNGFGTIYKITSSGVITTIYSFNGEKDGGVPASKLIVGSDGNLYGTASGYTELTIEGDVVTNFGSVFQITPDATGDGNGFTVLYHFPNDGSQGGTPVGGLTEGPGGTLYGTTTSGSDAYDTGFGTIYSLTVPSLTGSSGVLPSFFDGEVSVGNGVDYLAFPNGDYFGYYSFLTDPAYIYHYDLGYEYVFDANDGASGVYFYDFASNDFFYTSPTFPFPYLFDFNLDSVVYYYPNPNSAGHYTTNPRYFYVYNIGQIIAK